MAIVGLAYLAIAPFPADHQAGTIPKYTGGIVGARLVQANLTYERSETTLEEDNVTTESDNAITGNQFPDFVQDRVDSASYVIDSTEDINNAMTKGMIGTGDVSLAQISVDEVLQLAVRFNPNATFEGLKDIFHSEQLSVDALK